MTGLAAQTARRLVPGPHELGAAIRDVDAASHRARELAGELAALASTDDRRVVTALRSD